MNQIKIPKEKAKEKFLSFLSTIAVNEIVIHPTPKTNILRVTGDSILYTIANELLVEYNDLYQSTFTEDEKERLRTVKIDWMRRKAYKQIGCYCQSRNVVSISKWFKETENLDDQRVRNAVKGLLHHEFGHIKWFDHYAEFREWEGKCHYTELMESYNSDIYLALVFWVKGSSVEWGKVYQEKINGVTRAIIDCKNIETGKEGRFTFPLPSYKIMLELRKDGDI